jgi:hypothetical protein
MHAARLVHDRDHLRLGKQDAIRVAQRDALVDELLASGRTARHDLLTVSRNGGGDGSVDWS